MHLRRSCYPLAAVSLVAAAVPALAGPRPVCGPILTDPAGDSPWGRTDIVAGDFGTGRTEAAVQLKWRSNDAGGLPVQPDAVLRFHFDVSGVPVLLTLQRRAGPFGGGDEAAATVGGDAVEVVATVTRDGVVWRVPRRVFPVIKRNTVVTGIAADTSVAGLRTDEARSDKTYRWYAPSCLKAR